MLQNAEYLGKGNEQHRVLPLEQACYRKIEVCTPIDLVLNDGYRTIATLLIETKTVFKAVIIWEFVFFP